MRIRKENLSARKNRSNRESDARLLCNLKEKPQNKRRGHNNNNNSKKKQYP